MNYGPPVPVVSSSEDRGSAGIASPTRGDLIAGVGVALVVVPQAIAYAGIIGLPPQTGLYASALPAIVAALLGSSPYLQTGPTAAMALLAFGGLTAVAAPDEAGYVQLAALLAILVGAIRLVVGLARIGSIAYLMSQPVVVSFTAAAGILIVLSQVPAVLGVASADASPIRAAWLAVAEPDRWVAGSIVYGAVSFAVMVGIRRLHPLVPGAIVAVAGSIIVSRLTGFDGIVLGRVDTAFPTPSLDLPWGDSLPLIVAAGVIALVGFAEPSAIARHYATAERRRWDPSRELIGQGAANIVSGTFGGFPVGGSFSRTALAKQAGARTRWSGVIVGLIVLAVVPLLGLMSALPRATLGAVVIAAVLPLVTIRPLIEYWHSARLQFYVAAITFVVTIVAAPHVELGVVVGVLLAAGAHLYREVRLSVPTSYEDATLHVRPRGVLFYASAGALEETVGSMLSAQPDARAIVFHLDGLGRIDLTGALALRRLAEDARSAGVAVEFVDVPPQAAKIVDRVLGERTPVTLLVEDRRPLA